VYTKYTNNQSVIGGESKYQKVTASSGRGIGGRQSVRDSLVLNASLPSILAI